MEKIDVASQVKSLIGKAAEADKSEDAVRFSQAALNAAHAMSTVNLIPENPTD